MKGKISSRGTTFRDEAGRHVLLRGVNLGGDTKLPSFPDSPTYRPTDFASHRTVSFIGRPAPLDELDDHLDRLAGWGFNTLRLLTTWEAIEHEGPGLYDEAYLDYYAAVCRRAKDRGFYVLVDLHQDVWSRMSGGDGAPGWTWEAAGLDYRKFHSTQAALVMQHAYDPSIGGRQPSYPVMSWGGNYARSANGIIWTLFFAGEDFAPSSTVDGVSSQRYLQDHYLGAMRALAERVADLENIIGFDTLNEPGTGYIGKTLGQPILRGSGPLWSPLDGLAVASGITRTIPVLEFGKGVTGNAAMNEGGESIWLPGYDDPFRVAGAWAVNDRGEAVVVRDNYFTQVGNRTVEMVGDYMIPFFGKVAQTIRSVREDWLVFVETDPLDALIGPGLPPGCPERSVNANHWYDISALMTKSFSPDRMINVLTGAVREGEAGIQAGYSEELGRLRAIGDTLNGGSPTFIGECGIPYDINDAQSFARWQGGERDPDIWAAQTAALDLMYNSFDALLVSSTQWNYTVTNRNDPMIGDGWNQEDLSIWSSDQVDGASDGARAVDGFCRPFVRAAQGTIASQSFDRRSGSFVTVIDVDVDVAAPTELYLPSVQYPGGCDIVANRDASIETCGQVATISTSAAGPIELRISRRAS